MEFFHKIRNLSTRYGISSMIMEFHHIPPQDIESLHNNMNPSKWYGIPPKDTESLQKLRNPWTS